MKKKIYYKYIIKDKDLSLFDYLTDYGGGWFFKKIDYNTIERSEQDEHYYILKKRIKLLHRVAVITFVAVGILVIVSGCKDFEIDCPILEKHYRQEELSLIVDSPPGGSAWFSSTGRNPYTNKPKKYKLNTRWWNSYAEYINKGDTIIKKKGELIFYIYKKDTVFRFNWECKGQIYE